MGEDGKQLGAFLRARREAMTPEQAGLLDAGHRRTPGLRREEVAMLAGVSTDYYIRLEQGRERNPSERVLNALARVLDLGPEATRHLYELAHPMLRPHRRAPRPRVTRQLRRLIDAWPDTPALLCDRLTTILAANPLATALYDGFRHRDNLLRMIFLEPVAREFYPEWEKSARAKVAHLRAVAGADLDDPAVTALVGELSVKSADFRRLWARHDVSSNAGDTKRMRHPEVGDLTLTCEMFTVASSPGLQLITLLAEPGSLSEQALRLLGTLAATRTPASQAGRTGRAGHPAA
ncbi:transcriptional regulator with XRE-family HTH domain [Thermocatellispora tengchongensis]|uniref:Transcriptional regulator with XRE-family HTH domain n=1 Tax=Thermocatellispora tengchongensis TaxID=1073253 RepID=A0A840P635_9ACTN|nr:helix-turn-helix transcriptional regulator [Thermocatellispora tengchongensis]MBB5133321.1 transcriptional regulator with XRE-family HTH domain [Thermocatellispora tengchongensis]